MFEAINGSLTKINRQLLQLELATIRRLTDKIKECEHLIEEHLPPYEVLHLRLLKIPDISQTTVQVVIAEVGPTVATFESGELLASWAGLFQGSYESVGIQYGSKTTRGNP